VIEPPDSRGIEDIEWGSVTSLGCTVRLELGSEEETESILDEPLSFVEESRGKETKMSPVSRF
jgi:hypothetical protein